MKRKTTKIISWMAITLTSFWFAASSFFGLTKNSGVTTKKKEEIFPVESEEIFDHLFIGKKQTTLLYQHK